MDWYYASNGQQQGPVSKEQLIELHNSGQINGTDLVWNETMTEWKPYQTVQELRGGAIPAEAPVTPPVDTPASSTAAAPAPAPVATTAQPAASGETVPNYLWQSIALLVCCAGLFAIPALIFSLKVGPAVEHGDMNAAKEASAKAKMWCWIALGIGVLFNLIAGVVYAIYGAALAAEMR